MDRATLARAFDPFFTTKPVGKGTGMGLAMVHGIVREHGGAVVVDSMPGAGTQFRIYLPAVAEAVPLPQEPAAIKVLGAGRRVLYVDDEEALILLARRQLHTLGFVVSAYSNAEEALQAFRTQPGAFDVVVSDIAMPAMSGFELIRAVRAHNADVPVNLLSGHVSAEDRERANQLGVNAVLLKPLAVEDLARAIVRAL